MTLAIIFVVAVALAQIIQLVLWISCGLDICVATRFGLILYIIPWAISWPVALPYGIFVGVKHLVGVVSDEWDYLGRRK